MKILITGGCGFIGSNFIRYCFHQHPSYRIINLDKLTYAGNPANLDDVASLKNYRFVKGDIADRKTVESLMAGCEAVVHFAAETHVDRSILRAQDFIETNVTGTFVLLEAALRHRVKRFVHVSTDEVYGSRKTGFFKETDLLNPSSPYSASKASSDLLVKSYFVTYGLPVVITRCSNNFGPYQYPEKLIPLFVTNLIEGKKVPLYAQGLNVRDWIYVHDHCRAVDLVLHRGKIGEIYNIAGGNQKTNINLTKAILRNMKKPLSMIQHVKDRPGHDFRYAIHAGKIRKLGFHPQFSFEEALKQTIAWYVNHPTWWKKLKMIS